MLPLGTDKVATDAATEYSMLTWEQRVSALTCTCQQAHMCHACSLWKVGQSDPGVAHGRALAQRIKGRLGIACSPQEDAASWWAGLCRIAGRRKPIMKQVGLPLYIRAAHLPIGLDSQPRVLVYQVQGSQAVQGPTQDALCFLSLLLGLGSQHLHIAGKRLFACRHLLDASFKESCRIKHAYRWHSIGSCPGECQAFLVGGDHCCGGWKERNSDRCPAIVRCCNLSQP